MNDSILHTEIQEFINNNLNSDITKLLLKGVSFKGVAPRAIVEQIEAKKKSEKKLPTWFHTKNIYYPNKLNVAQTSSEITADYKSNLIAGKTLIDLTGGFGVDTYYFSKRFKSVIHCEINESLSKIVNHNFKQLKTNTIINLNVDGIEHLNNSNKTYDWIYVDPSRRDMSKRKVVFLNDCLPNIPKHLDMLFDYTKNIMLKTSPLLDISIGVKELKYTKAIHIIAVNNEVKELLWILEKNYNDKISMLTVNIHHNEQQHFNYIINEESETIAKYSEPLTYLYEPNLAILKSGAFTTITKYFNLFKIHKHSHIYTNDILIDFPGRVFKIINIIPYSKRKQLNILKANITTRNFPESVNQIRKNLKIKDGGDIYIYATTSMNGKKILLICTKV